MNRKIEGGASNLLALKEPKEEILSSDRVRKLEQVALRSQWLTRPHVFGVSMYSPLSLYEHEGGYPKIVEEQLQSTRERLKLPEAKPLVVGDLGCAFGIAVAQLNQMEGIEAFGVDQYRYPDVNTGISDDISSYFKSLSFQELYSLLYHPDAHKPNKLQAELRKMHDKTGLPISLKSFDLTLEMIRRERHIVSRIQRMKRIPNNIFDFLMSSTTLIHLDGEDLRNAAREIDRVLVPKGGVLLQVGKENARSVGRIFEGLRNVKVLYSGDDSLMYFKYE